MENKIDEINKKIREISLVISRVPFETKRTFIDIANAQFSGDYGMLLKKILDDAIEYQNMKVIFFENIDMKLDIIIDKLNNVKEEKPSPIKTLGRREMKGGFN